MRDMYEEFGNIFENHLNDLGYRSSGMILFTENWNDGKGPQKKIVRIEYDGDSDNFIFEYDFDEGQRCEFIACITDEELIDMWEEKRVNIQYLIEEKKGFWEWVDDMDYRCSCCHKYAYGCLGEVLSGRYKFCPYCGARMEKTDE